MSFEAFDSRRRHISSSEGTLTPAATTRLADALDTLVGTSLEDWYGGRPFITDGPEFLLSMVLDGTRVGTGYMEFGAIGTLESDVPNELGPLDAFVSDLYHAVVTCDDAGLINFDETCVITEPAMLTSSSVAP